jgi:hypothetical protein
VGCPALAALDHPVRSCQRRTARSIARYPDASVPYRPLSSTASLQAMTSIVADRLCESIPITTAFIAPSTQSAGDFGAREGNATSSCANPSRASPCPRQHPARADQMRATRQREQPN